MIQLRKAVVYARQNLALEIVGVLERAWTEVFQPVADKYFSLKHYMSNKGNELYIFKKITKFTIFCEKFLNFPTFRV